MESVVLHFPQIQSSKGLGKERGHKLLGRAAVPQETEVCCWGSHRDGKLTGNCISEILGQV